MILPSDLALIYNLHIICFLKINNYINIYSLANIEEDRLFKCTEFLNLHENFHLGVIIYKIDKKGFIKNDYKLFYLNKRIFNYDTKDDDIFNITKLVNQYNYSFNQSQNEDIIKESKLKQLYILKPFGNLKRNFINSENNWNFLNIFNYYFCYCKGISCLNIKISNICKYFFYIYIIDNNRNVYEKTDFLFMDFILKKYSSDDVYPIFQEMINKNISSHYLTEKKKIYKKYCKGKKVCDSVIYVNEKSYKINDEFLENHLTLILKLDKVISSVGVNITFINNIFYNIDYITYICVGHGVSFFKYYLYKEYYGPNNFDKLLIPNSDLLISCAKKYGWKEENLIKMNLPRWDKYNHEKRQIRGKGNMNENSVFFMFTWRELKTNKNVTLSYFENIIKILNNEILINKAKENYITLYFSIHHKFIKYKDDFTINQYIKTVGEDDISDCLSKTSLIVTDYSSIIFDMIYRRKPYIIFIPDAYDPEIKINYLKTSYNIIKKFKYNHFSFENIFFDINSTVNKINYYIDNRFELDLELIKLYNDFKFKRSNAKKEFIDYLLNNNH